MALTFARGFDGGCELAIYGAVPGSFLRFLLDSKERAKKEESRVTVEYKGVPVIVAPMGTHYKQGDAGKGINYQFQFYHGGVWFMLREKSAPTIPTIRLKFNYESLRERDLFAKAREIRELLEGFGCTIDEITVSRVDYQITSDRFTVEEFVDAKRDNRIVLNGRKVQVHEGSRYIEGFYIGRGSELEICVYNKAGELSAHWDDQKFLDACEVCGGTVPDNFTRFEVRFKRDYLRRYGVRTLEELENHFYQMLGETLNRNCRITAKSLVRGMENKQELSPLFALIMSLMFGSVEPIAGKNRPKLKKAKVGPSRYIRQAMGYFTSGLAQVYSRSLVDDIKARGSSLRALKEDGTESDISREMSLSLAGLLHKYSRFINRSLCKKINMLMLGLL